jgi:hypothetical protein
MQFFQGGMFGDMDGMFSSMGSMRGGMPGMRGMGKMPGMGGMGGMQRGTQHTQVKLPCSLEDLYTGACSSLKLP